jgi:hypothetical protein
MNTTQMRPLSAASYALLMKLQCPMLAVPTEELTEQLRAATLWHYIHTANIDAIEQASDAEIVAAANRHGYTLEFAAYGPIFRRMTQDIERMQAAFVESEPTGGKSPLVVTTPTSQISESH